MWMCGLACFIHRCVLAKSAGFFFSSLFPPHMHSTLTKHATGQLKALETSENVHFTENDPHLFCTQP